MVKKREIFFLSLTWLDTLVTSSARRAVAAAVGFMVCWCCFSRSLRWHSGILYLTATQVWAPATENILVTLPPRKKLNLFGDGLGCQFFVYRNCHWGAIMLPFQYVCSWQEAVVLQRLLWCEVGVSLFEVWQTLLRPSYAVKVIVFRRRWSGLSTLLQYFRSSKGQVLPRHPVILSRSFTKHGISFVDTCFDLQPFLIRSLSVP